MVHHFAAGRKFLQRGAVHGYLVRGVPDDGGADGPNSIQSTDMEPELWAQFWADQGFMLNEVVYFKRLGKGSL